MARDSETLRDQAGLGRVTSLRSSVTTTVLIQGMIIPIMGMNTTEMSPPLASTSLADVLFTPVQQRVLGL